MCEIIHQEWQWNIPYVHRGGHSQENHSSHPARDVAISTIIYLYTYRRLDLIDKNATNIYKQ